MIGQVIKTTGNIYLTKIGEDIVEAGIKGRFRIHDIQTTNPIVVGDIVKLTNDSGTFIINELVDRKNYIVRKSVNLSKQEHIIASNIDQAILLITLTNPITTTSFIDRFLVLLYT